VENKISFLTKEKGKISKLRIWRQDLLRWSDKTETVVWRHDSTLKMTREDCSYAYWLPASQNTRASRLHLYGGEEGRQLLEKDADRVRPLCLKKSGGGLSKSPNFPDCKKRENLIININALPRRNKKRVRKRGRGKGLKGGGRHEPKRNLLGTLSPWEKKSLVSTH